MPKPYRVLFLSASIGSGHMKAAEAVKESLQEKYGDRLKTTIIDAFDYTSTLLNKVVLNTYMEMIKLTPSLYRYLYQKAETTNNMTEFSSILNKLMTTKLKKLIIGFRPDIVICTHIFPCAIMSALKDETGFNKPAIAIITDFTVHNFWIYPNIDMYIVAAEKLKEELIERNIPEEKIAVTGIPIHPSFAEHSRVRRHDWDLSEHIPVLTVMGGGFGCGPLKSIVRELAKITLPMQVIVIAGQNKLLLQKINEMKKELSFPLHVLGYVDNVNEIMELSDLLITKPGGLTSAEALSKSLPIIIAKPIPGQEEKNADFLIQHEVAVKADGMTELRQQIEKILSEPKLLVEMKERTKEISHPNSAEAVVRLIDERYIQSKDK